MLKHLELSTPTSCLNKADDNEPIFVLRAKDPLAAVVVRHWATLAAQVSHHEKDKCAEALACANEMRVWGNAYMHKMLPYLNESVQTPVINGYVPPVTACDPVRRPDEGCGACQ